jgi:hypothetical protein
MLKDLLTNAQRGANIGPSSFPLLFSTFLQLSQNTTLRLQFIFDSELLKEKDPKKKRGREGGREKASLPPSPLSPSLPHSLFLTPGLSCSLLNHEEKIRACKSKYITQCTK